MTAGRRALGRGRLLVALGAFASVVGLFLEWWRVERTNLEALGGTGFESTGVVVFVAALAMIAVLILPSATRGGESALDRPGTYVVLAATAIGAYLWRLYEISQFGGLGLPDRSAGAWLTGGGLIMIAWGVGELLTDRRLDY